jgi:hypothetical protein
MRSLSRFLQLLGLVVTGVGFFDGVFTGNARRELVFLGVGVVLFFTGRMLARENS